MNSRAVKIPTPWCRSIAIRCLIVIPTWCGGITRSWARTNRLMVLGNLVFSSANWLWLTVILLSLALILLGWSYWRAGSAPLRWTCLVLKLLGFAALAVCLLEPLWSGQRARPGANIFAVVADNSA